MNRVKWRTTCWYCLINLTILSTPVVLLIYPITLYKMLKFLSYQKGWVLPHSRGFRYMGYHPGPGQFQKKTRIWLFFTDPNQGSKTESIHSGGPFEHRSFKLKSTFNPVGPFQLESMFHSIEQDLHRQKYKRAQEEKLNKRRIQGNQVTHKQ